MRLGTKRERRRQFNTDMICRISKAKNGYTVFFSSGNVGAANYEYDEVEARKIFDAIGVMGDCLRNDKSQFDKLRIGNIFG